MAKFWWQCGTCSEKPAWLAVCKSKSIAAFIWDELAPSGWDQKLLRRPCSCRRGTLRITYRFKGSDPERISIQRIVGFKGDGDYLLMLWETYRHSAPKVPWIDFKYQRGRSPWGLSKRVAMTRVQCRRLLRSYDRVTVS